MKYIELYDNKKTYYYRTGKVATPSVLAQDYPILNLVPCVVETDKTGKIFSGFSLLSDLREQYGISDTTSDEDAITAIKNKSPYEDW